MFSLEKIIFSKEYRRMVSDLKRFQRKELREEEKMYDIRTGPPTGRKGSADMSGKLPKSRQSGGNPRKKSRPVDREEEKNSDAGAASPDVGQV